MPTERLRSHEVENQRSDHMRRDTSSKQGGQIRDFATHPHQLHDQQRNGKSAMTPEMQWKDIQNQQEKWHDNNRKAIQEIIEQRDGKTSPHSQIPLGYQEGLRGGGKLTAGNWNTLKNSLNTIEDAFNAKESESNIKTKLKNLRKEVEKYMKKGDENDNIYLGKIDKRLPEDAKDTVFLDGIRVCLDYVENGSR